ncbi:MAG: patatin-like phospholipase family protein [Candidatus Binataceae bacterium]
MSGGGARGAYEAGVLSYLFEELSPQLDRPIHFDIVTGTSVGAIHACWVAASQDDPSGGARLTATWRSLSLEHVFPVGPAEVVRVPWRLLGLRPVSEWMPARAERAPERLPGLFDSRWIESTVLNGIPWETLRRNIDEGRLYALAVAATEIATGRSVVFVDTALGETPRWAGDPFVIARDARIGPTHALASASIPLIFPAVRVDGAYCYDGGLRLNTPLAPALRLGADRVLVIGLRYQRTPGEEDRLATQRLANYSSVTYLAGKALNALLLDRVEYDVGQLRLFNAILQRGFEVYGPEFLVRINEPIKEMRNTPYRIVDNVFIRPSQDIGAIAAECIGHQRSRGLSDWLSRNVARYAARGTTGEADLLSYLLFDQCYIGHLIELGRHDAEQASDELAKFFS